MAQSLNFGPKFERLIDYREWNREILGDLAYVGDEATVTLLASKVAEFLNSGNIPADLAGWVSSDLLATRQSLDRMHELLCTLGLADLTFIVDAWHERLASVPRECACDENLLACGPGPAIDGAMSAAEFWDLVGATGLLATASSRSPQDEALDLADVVAYLVAMAKQPGTALKPFIGSEGLQVELQRAFASAKRKTESLGGAQTNIARALRKLGIKADVCWPYHAQEVAAFADRETLLREIRVLDLRDGVVDKRGFEAWLDFRPVRRSSILTTAKGDYLGGVEVTGSDRLILQPRRPTLQGGGLTAAKVVCHDGREILRPNSWRTDEYPAVPLIGSATAVQGSLVFRAAAEPLLQSVAREYRRISWGGLAVLDDPGYSVEARRTLADEFAFQVASVTGAAGGAFAYLELSGVPRDPALVRTITSAGADCVGLNHTELLQLTGASASASGFPWCWPGSPARPEPLIARYYRAVALARYFGTDLLVHGPDCNLFVTPDPDPQRLRQAVSALLAASMAVVTLIDDKTRAGSSFTRPSLSEKGFLTLLAFAHDFARLQVDPNLAPSAQRDCVRTLMLQILSDGHLSLPSSGPEMSFAIAPGPWPGEVQRANPTGAGDTIAAVPAALLPRRRR